MTNKTVHTPKSPFPPFPPKQNNLKQALYGHRFGFTVIPIIPGQKRPATKWDEWENNPSEEKVRIHWRKHPDHEVGCITNDSLMVLDADSPEALKALYYLEKIFDIQPLLIVETSKGEHHYFKRPNDMFAKQDSHSTDKYPDRIDIKTDRSLVILPPSGGREIKLCEIDHIDELTSVTQEFVDALFKHNGRPPPRPQEVSVKKRKPVPPFASLDISEKKARKLLDSIDSDCGYDDWRNVGMGLHNYFSGDDEGLDLFDQWSSKGQEYPGRREIESKWKSFANYSGAPITISTLYQMAKENGADLSKIPHEDDFVACEMTVIYPEVKAVPSTPKIAPQSDKGVTILSKYALNGKSQEFKEQMEKQQFLLDGIASMGESTVIAAPPSTGKTLLLIWQLMESGRSTDIQMSKVYYVNADDTLRGLAEKLELAEECGFQMLAPGHEEFSAKQLLKDIAEMTATDTAKGAAIILDTLKKFTDPMNKSMGRELGILLREFTAKGGAVVMLGHANKHPDAAGKPIIAGTSDIADDVDCGYILYEIEEDTVKQVKTVVYENFKNRGNVERRVVFKYSTAGDLSYPDLLLSVERVDNETASKLHKRGVIEVADSEPEVVEAVLACLAEGICKKMELAQAAAKKPHVSRRSVRRVIEKYTGDDPDVHKWNYKVAERGAKLFYTLTPALES